MNCRIYIIALAFIIISCMLVGCSENDVISGDSTFYDQSELQTLVSEETEATEPSTFSDTDNSHITKVSPESSFEKGQTSSQHESETTSQKETVYNTSTDSNETDLSNPPQVSISSLSVSLHAYASVNELKPYLKDKPIYQYLYDGSRVQIGDALTYNLFITPPQNNGNIIFDSTDNLSCNLTENTLSITVNHAGDYNMGRVTLYGMSPDGRKIDAEYSISFVVDVAGDPYNNLSVILSEYIRKSGMQYTSVENGYTASNPALSITNYPDAPAWDDQIDKSQSDYISKCFQLIDEYSSRGFNKVNFIITETSVGFCASK